MRLTIEQRHIIKEAVFAQFGVESAVWLFGSRVDDSQRGGDIDLYVQVKDQSMDLLQAELSLHANLIKKLGDQRVDLVIHQANQRIKPIHEQALKTGVQL